MNVQAQNEILIQNKKNVLNVSVYSNDKTETIILLHGGPGVPDDMLEVVEQLKIRYKVITFEQRGTGLSECNGCDYKMEDYISDIDAITEYLKVDRFHLFGHSWGGLYAQIYAEANPNKIKSLFLCSPSSGTNLTWKRTEREVMQFNKQATTIGEWMSMGWYSLVGMMGSDKAYQKVFTQVLKNYHKNYGDIEIKQTFLEKIYADPINKTRKEIVNYRNLTQLSNPKFNILITYGNNDIYGESKNELLERYPTANVKILKNCGHIPWKHNPTLFNSTLAKFYL